MRAKRIRTSRAKTVPPGPAMGPNMVLAARKTERVVRERVSRLPRGPLGADCYLSLFKNVIGRDEKYN